MSNYRTNNIDEAAFLAIKGFKFKVKVKGERTALYTFETGPRFEEVRKMFWSKGALISLHAWLSMRQTLKHYCATQAAQGAYRVHGVDDGMPYWYVRDGVVLTAIYGSKNRIHLDRKRAGNFYKTRAEAEATLKVHEQPLSS